MAPNERLLQIRTIDQPGVHASIRAMRRVADSYPDRVMIGEAYLPIDQLMAYYGADLTGFHLPFNFHLISTDWKPTALASLIEAYEAALPAGAWPNWVLGNHDRSRVASRIGPAQARVAAMLLMTLRERRRSTRARKSGWWTRQFRRTWCRTRSSGIFRAFVSAAIPFGHQCRGAPRPMAVSPRDGLGFRSMRTPTG